MDGRVGCLRRGGSSTEWATPPCTKIFVNVKEREEEEEEERGGRGEERRSRRGEEGRRVEGRREREEKEVGLFLTLERAS